MEKQQITTHNLTISPGVWCLLILSWSELAARPENCLINGNQQKQAFPSRLPDKDPSTEPLLPRSMSRRCTAKTDLPAAASASAVVFDNTKYRQTNPC